MANTFAGSRNRLIVGLCLALAVLPGYLVADVLDSGNLAAIVSVMSVPLNDYRHGVPAVLQIHTLLLLSFLVRTVFCSNVCGSFDGAMVFFTGLRDLSITGSSTKPAPTPIEKPAFDLLKLARVTR